jgi:hypothetical protein
MTVGMTAWAISSCRSGEVAFQLAIAFKLGVAEFGLSPRNGIFALDDVAVLYMREYNEFNRDG